eukprot:4580-Heterococcus_DN1.PRE.1
MQVVFGLYPIAQVREPFSNVRFVAENCWPRLDKSLKLHHIASKGFFVKGKGGRPDALRAANKLLRDALNGRSGAIISFYPPDSSSTTVDAKELPADTPFLYCVDEIDTPTTAAQEEQYEQKVHSRKARE